MPDLASLRSRLESAQAAFHAGDLGRAAQAFRAIVAEIPDQPDALHMLGAIAYRMGRNELALSLFDEALRAAPQFAQAWNNRALVLRVLGRADEALESARRCVAADAAYFAGWDMIGLLLHEKGDNAGAVEHHERALQIDPSSAFAWNNVAIALMGVDRLADAYRAARRAVAANPQLTVAHLTLGNVLSAAGYADRALRCYEEARRLDASIPDMAFTEGITRMLVGDFAAGWALMENRSYDAARFGALPRWKGEKVRHLFVQAEQGGGDALQFMRYLPMIRDRAQRITLEIAPGMRRLLAAHFDGIELIEPADDTPAADAYALLLSLPHLLGTRLDTVPAEIPYLRAPEEWRAPWRERLAHIPRPRIGVLWQGNPRYKHDRYRSLSLEHIRPLIEAVRPHLVSVQKGLVTATSGGAGIFDAEPWLEDFAATAGLLAELDLVISSDTAVPHLAGAMGRPVWMLNAFMPDWRWMLAREDTPWYPTMRLIRQNAPRDWPPVITRVTEMAQKFIGGDETVLAPPRWSGPPAQHNPNPVELPE